MAQHELNIRADIDTTRVQRKLDNLNNANKAGAGNAGNATDVNVVLRNLQHSLDALNRTLQDIVRGNVQRTAQGGSGSALTDVALMKGLSSGRTGYSGYLQSLVERPIEHVKVRTINELVHSITSNEIATAYNLLGARSALGRPLSGRLVRWADRSGNPNMYLMNAASLFDNSTKGTTPLGYQMFKWNTDAPISSKNIVSGAYNAVQWSRGVGRANPWVGAGIGFAGHAAGMLGQSLANAGYEDAGQKLHSASSIAMMGAAGWTLGGPLGAGIGIAVGAISELAAAAGRASKELNQIRASGAAAQFDAGQTWEKWAIKFMTPEQLITKRDTLKSAQKSLYQNLGSISRELDTLDPVKDRDRYTQLTSMAEQIMKQDLPNVSAMLEAYKAEAEKRPTAEAINEEMANKSHEEFVNELLQKYDESAGLIKQREEALLELEQAMKVQGVDILDAMSKQGKWMSDFAMGSTTNPMFSPVTQRMDSIINKLEHLNSIDQEIKRLDMGLK